ncbi:MAG: hypothetical protein A2749_00840 [Parcubacteria group bacterium RIFCSPHIGHO2_01_FULL_45_26]|nr:MAG: hypothetical protein A2749_00840 [Parcubacteria group bacterium RIFCSPHIGHO2_01_FULL_45_26]
MKSSTLRYAVAILACLSITGIISAATTISTNIDTGGNLSVTGGTTLTGAVAATGAVTLGDAATDVILSTGIFQASSTALFGGAVTTYANSTFGDAATDISLFTGRLHASSTALLSFPVSFYDSLTFASTTATTTVSFTSTGINFDSNTFVLDPNSNRIGILTATPAYSFEVNGTASSSNLIAGVSLGVASSSPSTTFGVAGSGYFSTGLGVGILNTTAGSILANVSVGVASSSPYVALGVTGTTTSSAGMVIGAGGTALNQVLSGTCTYNPAAAITGSTTLSTNCTSATGVRNGDRVYVTPRTLETHLIMTSASSTATDDVIQVSVYNTGVIGAITPTSATWTWMAIR